MEIHFLKTFPISEEEDIQHKYISVISNFMFQKIYLLPRGSKRRFREDDCNIQTNIIKNINENSLVPLIIIQIYSPPKGSEKVDLNVPILLTKLQNVLDKIRKDREQIIIIVDEMQEYKQRNGKSNS